MISFSGNDGFIHYAIYSADGIKKLALQNISISAGASYSDIKSNSYAVGKNIYFIGWDIIFSDHSNMYFVLYNKNNVHNNINPLVQGSAFNDYILSNEPRILAVNPICVANPI